MEIWLLFGRLTLTGLLYLFLIAIFVVLWRDMHAAAPASLPAAQAPDGKLIVLEGNQDIQAGAVLPLQPFTTLGRGAINTIVVPDTYASAEHAIIAWRGSQWWLEDRGSRNGTMLNDVRIEAPMVLDDEDVIGIGRIKLRLEIED